MTALRLLGLDPGLRKTGWGIIETEGSHLRHLANGSITTNAKHTTAERLVTLHEGLAIVLDSWLPTAAAVEETFVNANPTSTLKLGMARSVALLTPARLGASVSEYSANKVKKSVVGVGHAEKKQVAIMVRTLLPSAGPVEGDAADALAIAICHCSRVVAWVWIWR